MAKVQYKRIDRSNRQLAGLVDGGHTRLDCSNCGKPLVDIWHTRPDEELDGTPVKSRLQAHCCYCGDHSNTVVVTGGFHPGGYGEPGEDEEAGIDHVFIINVEMQTAVNDPDGCFQKVFFQTKKARDE